jgi:hypothetical protein
MSLSSFSFVFLQKRENLFCYLLVTKMLIKIL